MFTPQQLIQLVQESQWPATEKQRLLGLVSRLGEHSINYLYKEIDTFFSEVIAEDMVNAFEKTIKAIEIARQNPADIISILRTAPDDAGFDFGRFVIPVVADFHPSLTANKSLEDEVRNFEIKVFKDLPESELQGIVKEHLLYAYGKMDVLMEFKRLNYNRHIGYDMKWGKMYSYNMENNEEVFGKSQLIIDGKMYKPEVRYWVKDFILSQPLTVIQRGSFEEIQYLKKSANATKLTTNEQKLLLEIIKLYKWFSDPVVTREEVEEYEKSLEEKLEEQEGEYEDVPARPLLPKVTAPLKPSAPISFGFKNPITSPVRPPVAAPPVKSASIEQLIKRAAPPAVPPLAPKPSVKQDESKAPISTIADILKQKEQLQHKIDEKLDELSHRVKK